MKRISVLLFFISMIIILVSACSQSTQIENIVESTSIKKSETPTNTTSIDVTPNFERTPEPTVKPVQSTETTVEPIVLPKNIEELLPYLKNTFPKNNLEIYLDQYEEDPDIYSLFFMQESGNPADAPSEDIYEFALREVVMKYLTTSYEAIFSYDLPVVDVLIVINPYKNKGAPLYSISLGKGIAENIGKENWISKGFDNPTTFFDVLNDNITRTNINFEATIDERSNTCYVLGTYVN